jgi:hypothetical protein
MFFSFLKLAAQSVKLFYDFPVMSLDILSRRLIHPFFYLFAGHWSSAAFYCLARYVIGKAFGGALQQERRQKLKAKADRQKNNRTVSFFDETFKCGD